MSTAPAPLEDFFAHFANLNLDFTYSEESTAHDNFKRLRDVFQWDKSSTELSIARVNFHDALVEQFNFVYGTDDDLGAWQKLCSVIDITPVPDDIKDCKRLVWDAHVNIVDLLESARTGAPVQKFATLEDLRAYTKKRGKMFPKESAYGGLLKELLREIIHPYFGRRRNGSEKRKRRKARKQAAAVQSC